MDRIEPHGTPLICHVALGVYLLFAIAAVLVSFDGTRKWVSNLILGNEAPEVTIEVPESYGTFEIPGWPRIYPDEDGDYWYQYDGEKGEWTHIKPPVPNPMDRWDTV